MAFNRANPFLNEIIADLSEHLERNRNDIARATENLSKDDSEWIDQELIHCITDARYFISNYYAYKDEKAGFRGLYPLFDSQEILHEEYAKLQAKFGRVRALVLKARQMGSTTYNCARLFHSTIFSEHINGLIVGQDEDQANYIFGMYDSAYDFLPWWMKPRIAIRQSGKKILFDERDESLRSTRPGLKTWIFAENANKPSGVGRGRTFNRALLSELSFWANGSQLSKSLFPTMQTPDGFYVMESTANGRNNFWHNLWRRAEAGKIDWNPIYIPFYRREKTYSLPISRGEKFELTEEEQLLRKQLETNENYFIKDEVLNWRRNKIEEFIATDGDDKMFQQEYSSNAEESFQTSAITAFPVGLINKLLKQTVRPLYVGEIIYDFKAGRPKTLVHPVMRSEHIEKPERDNRFHIWENPIMGERYAMGVDVSLGNDGGDYSCIQVVKLSSGYELDEQVAVWRGLIDPESLAEVVFAVGWMYNEALAAVEVNNMGMATNNQLIRRLEYENIYRFKRLDRLKNFMTDIIGWWTDDKSKRALITKMSKTLLEHQLLIRDRNTVDEFYDFTEEGAEGGGAHDDYVMALLIAVYCGREGEYREVRDGKAAVADKSRNLFEVKDRFGTIIASTTSQNEAERIAGKHVGTSIVRTAGATANVTLKGKVRKIPSDLQSTDWSPIHDGDGSAHRLYYEEGMEAEDINPEAIAEYEAQQDALEEDPNSWMYA